MRSEIQSQSQAPQAGSASLSIGDHPIVVILRPQSKDLPDH